MDWTFLRLLRMIFLTTAGSASGLYFRLGHRCRALTERGGDIRPVEMNRYRLKTYAAYFDRNALLEIVRKKLREKNVEAAYVLGSFSKEIEHYWSDLDLLISAIFKIIKIFGENREL
jgi:hypothetical protein